MFRSRSYFFSSALRDLVFVPRKTLVSNAGRSGLPRHEGPRTGPGPKEKEINKLNVFIIFDLLSNMCNIWPNTQKKVVFRDN